MKWRKSSYSGLGNCVEVGADADHAVVLIRDTKHPDAGELRLPRAAWSSFLAGLKHGELS